MQLLINYEVMIKYIIISLLIIVSLSAEDFVDGQWNGKPWKKSHLLAEVEKGNPDALAEWACCSKGALSGIPYNKALIRDYSLKSIEGGSALGKAFYGNYLIASSDDELKRQGYALNKEAIELGHPKAISGLARRLLIGTDIEQDIDRSYELLKKSEESNCSLAIGILGYLYSRDETSKWYDMEKSISYRKKTLSMFGSVYAATNLNGIMSNDRLEAFHHLIDLDTIDAADLRIAEAAELGEPYALFTQATRYLEAEKPHIAIPMMIRSANLDNAASLAVVSDWFYKGLELNENGSKELIVQGYYYDAIKFAGLSFRSGNRTSETLRHYARELFATKGDRRKEFFDKAEQLLMTKLNPKDGVRYDCNCHDELAVGLMTAYRDNEELVDDAIRDRSIAHYIYHSDHSEKNGYWVGWYFLKDKKDKLYDPVKGIAAATTSLKRGSEKFNKAANKYIKRAKKGITDEQLAEIEELVKDGYPTSEKYRREAYEHLLKIGDLSPEHKFRANK